MAMNVLVTARSSAFWRVKRVAGLLLLPYLAWLCLATALNLRDRRLNPGADRAPLGITGEFLGNKAMQSQNRFFEDFVKIMNGAAGTVAGMTREAQDGMRERMKEWVAGMDFVSRDEFEAVKAMAATAREEVEALKAASPRSRAARAARLPDRRVKAPPAGTTGIETPEE
jgi:BMFP domain-containing protein YqiC